MSDSAMPTQPAKSSSGLKVVLIVVAVIVLLGLLACGGMLALVYFGFNQMNTALRDEVETKQVVQDEIGDITAIKMDWGDTSKRAEAGGNNQTLSYSIEGNKGSGHLLVEAGQTGSKPFKSLTLVTSDGQEIPLPLDGSGDIDSAGDTNFDPSDIDLGESTEFEGGDGTDAGQP